MIGGTPTNWASVVKPRCASDFLCIGYARAHPNSELKTCAHLFFRHHDVTVGVVAGLVKVANGQTDRLARIFVAQRPLRAHWGPVSH